MKLSTHIGKSSWGIHLVRLFTGTKTDPDTESKIIKTYPGTDDAFFEEATKLVCKRVKLTTTEEISVKAEDKLREVKNTPIAKPKSKPLKQKSKQTDLSKELRNRFIKKYNVRETSPYSANPYSDLYREFPKLQVSIQNSSTEDKQVVLWGSQGNFNLSAPSPEHVEAHVITSQVQVPTGIHPQGMTYNPVSKFVYVANQISGTVSVFDTHNVLFHVIQLSPTLPGLCSPVSLTVNTNPASLHYGYVYVACSVANTVAVIDLLFNVVINIPVSVRPLAITFNPVNNLVYVANLVSDNVSVINSETHVVETSLPSTQDPIGIGVNPETGEVYIINSLSNNVTIYNSFNALVTVIAAISDYPVSVTYNPANHNMYVTATNSNRIYQINPLSHSVISSIATGNKPYNSFFNSDNNYLYVQNRQDNTFTIIRPDNTKIDGISVGEQNIGGVFNPTTHSIYISDTTNNAINIIGYLETFSALSVNPEYTEMNEEFKATPAIIQHVKFVVNGPYRLYGFRRNRFTPTGTNKSKWLSFEAFASPQSHLNVAEVYELAGTIIDRKMNWSFMLPGLHKVTIIIQYRQIQVAELLNQQSHN